MTRDPSATGNFKLHLPRELVQEVARTHGDVRDDFQVEGWQPSLVSRFLDLFSGRRSR